MIKPIVEPLAISKTEYFAILPSASMILGPFSTSMVAEKELNTLSPGDYGGIGGEEWIIVTKVRKVIVS